LFFLTLFGLYSLQSFRHLIHITNEQFHFDDCIARD